MNIFILVTGELRSFTEIDGLQKLFDKYGPIFKFEGVFGIGRLVFVNDPETAAHVSIRMFVPF